jgi:phosphonate transport system permease protein
MEQSKQIQPIHAPSKLRYTIIFLVLAVLYVFSWRGVEADLKSLIEGWPNIQDLIAGMWPPNWNYFQKILDPMLETLRIAVISTTFGAILSIPFTLFASRNVFPNSWVTNIARGFLNIIRTIPDLLLAGIFVAMLGIGPVAGVAAMTVFTFGIITKLAYESVETIDPGPLEAMTAVGANKLQFIAYAVVPQALPSFVAYVLYAFEICVRAAAILGLVGAGGIGIILSETLETFQYTKMASIVLFTLFIVIVIDTISTKIREKLL